MLISHNLAVKFLIPFTGTTCLIVKTIHPFHSVKIVRHKEHLHIFLYFNTIKNFSINGQLTALFFLKQHFPFKN